MLKLRNPLITGLLVLLGYYVQAQDIYADSTTTAASPTCVGCAVLNPGNAVDGDNSTYSTVQTALSVLGGTVDQTLYFPVTGVAGDTVVLKLGFADTLLADANALGNISVQSVLNGAPNNDATAIQSSALSALDTSTFEFVFHPGAAYNGVMVRITAPALSFATRVDIYSGRIVHTVIIPGGSGIAGCENPDGQTNSIGGGCTAATCSVDNPSAIITADPTDFATLSIAVGLANGFAEVTGLYSDSACTADSAILVIENPGGTLTGSAQGSVVAMALLNGVVVYSETLQSGNLSLISGGNVYSYTFKPNTIFNGIRIQLNSGAAIGSLSELRVYQMCLRRLPPPVPLGERDRTICHGSSTTITATPPPGSVARFYDAREGGNFLGEGSYTTSNLTTDSTFYVESFDTTTTCRSLDRDSITVHVFPEVLPPDNPQDTAFTCFNRRATITPRPFGNTFKFYSDSLGTDSIGMGSSYVTDTLRSDTVFYIRNTHMGLCNGDSVVPVYVRFFPDPFVADIEDTLTYCNNTTITITINEQTPGITYRWYTADSTLIFTGNPFTGFDLTMDTTLFIETIYGQCEESQFRKPLFIDAIEPSTVDVEVLNDTLYVCPGDTALGYATSTTDSVEFDWYHESGGLFFTGNPVKISDNGDTVRVYVKARAGLCSSSDSAFLTVIRIVEEVFFDSTRIVCQGDSALLFSESNIQGAVYSWYDVPEGGAPIFVGDTFVTPPIDEVSVYYFEVSNVSCIGQQRFPIYIYVSTLKPTVSADRGLYYFCTGDEISVSATGSDGSTISWHNAPEGGITLFKGNPYNFVPSGGDSILIFAQANFDQCESDDRAPILLVKADNISNVTAPGDTICEGQSTQLFATSQIQGAEYSWWDQQAGGTRIALANPFNTPVLFNSTDYYVQVEFMDDICPNRPRTLVPVRVERILEAPQVTCGPAGNDSVSFVWNGVGAQSYEISLDGGQTFAPVNNALGPNSHVVRNLTPDSNVTAIVRGIAALPCANSPYSVARTCVANECGLNNTMLDRPFYEVCADSSATITLLNLPEGYRIVFDNGAPTTNTSFNYVPAGVGQFTIPIQVYIEGEVGCDTLHTSAVVLSRPVPIADIDAIALSPNITGQFINTYQFISHTIGDAIWFWDFGDGTTSNEKNPVHTYASDGSYIVSLHVINSFGCDDSDTLDRRVIVSHVPDIFIPNTFTPNGDGKNDLFKIFGQNIRLESFKIFNIYGNLVFESNDLNRGWDGKYNGEPVPSGDYYYTAIIRDELNIKYDREGTITVIRK